MLKIKRGVSILVLIAFICTMGWNIPPGYAEEKALRVAKVSQKYDIGSNWVTLEWDRVLNAQTYTINYTDSFGNPVSIPVTATTDSIMQYKVTNLLPGFVYDFQLQAQDGGGVELIGADDNYRIKVITAIRDFKASKIDETIAVNQTEIGTKPGLKISWDKPEYFSGMLSQITSGDIEYEINIRKSKSSTADTIERFYIANSGGGYTIRRWDGNAFVDVANPGAGANNYNLDYSGNEISFTWTTLADAASGISKPTALKPGAIYYIQIYPRFYNDTGQFYETHYIETELDKDFVSTYLHVKLVRHSADNALMTAYRVRNDGTFVTVPNFLYEFWVGPDQNNLSRAYFEREEDAGTTAEEYIDAFLANTANFENYYKVTATTDESQDGSGGIELTSQVLHVNLSAIETTLPPMPENMEIISTTLDDDKITPVIKIRWDKPTNYDEMIDTADSQDYYYHMLLNTAIEDLFDDAGHPIKENLYDHEGNFLGSYDVQYREAISIEIKADDASLPEEERLKIISAHDIQPGELNTGKDRIEYTLIGRNLFEGLSYPDTLLLNKVYYLEMFTERTDGIDTLASNKTLPIAFTTPRSRENKPPLPLHLNIKEVSDHDIVVAWERVEVYEGEYFPADEGTPIVHYEISVSKKKDREEIEVDDLEEDGAGKYGAFLEPLFTVTSDDSPTNPIVTFFPTEIGKAREVTIHGDDITDITKTLDANTTYYVIIRTKLVDDDGTVLPKYSAYSQTLAATTLKTEIVGPGEEEKYPLAPDDFAVAEDADGNPLVDSYSATLIWSDNNTPSDETYPNGMLEYEVLRTEVSIENAAHWDGDPDSLDVDEYSPLLIDPDDIVSAYDSVNRSFKLKVEGMAANKVYFFSIRAKKTVQVNGEDVILCSEWITVPVTTLILEAPTLLSVVEPDEEDVEDRGFDKYHHLKINWKGLKQEDINGDILYEYEVAIKAEDESVYTIIRTGTNHSGIDIDYLDSWQNGSMIGTNYKWYSAFITGLKSNTKYYIKIRTVDVVGNSESKFTEVVSARTEFNTDDYEEEEQKKNNDASFLDSVNRFKDTLFWVYEDSSSSKSIKYSIKLRGSKVVNHLRNISEDEFVIDFATVQKADSDKKSECTVYIPIKVIEVLYETDKTLVLDTINGSFEFRPGVLDTSNTLAIEEMMEKKKTKSSVKDVYVSITMEDLKYDSKYEPSYGKDLISNISLLSAEAQAFAMTDDDFEQLIFEELYGEDGTGGTEGIIFERRQDLGDINPDPNELEEEIEELMDEIEEELGEFIQDLIESSSNVKYSEDIEELPMPMSVKLKYQTDATQDNYSLAGHKAPGNSDNWEKLLSEDRPSEKLCMFEVGELDDIMLAVIGEGVAFYDIYGHQYQQEIEQMNRKYNLTEVLYSFGYFEPDAKITTKDAVLIFKRITEEYQREYSNSDLVSVAKQLGLDQGLNLNRLNGNITRQQAAFMAMRLYEIQTQSKVENMTVTANITLMDEQQINSNLLKSVLLSVDLGLMEASSNVFRPNDYVTKAEFIAILKRVLDKLGRM